VSFNGGGVAYIDFFITDLCCLFFFTDAIGVPLFLFVELYRHRIHFYVKGDGTFSDRHDWAYQRLGDLFTQYE